MIPTEEQARLLWVIYKTPEKKKIHLQLVADVSEFFAKKLMQKDSAIDINLTLLLASALLHDIDKGVEKLPGEKHPDAAVRILKEEQMHEVAEVVKTHPVHMILDTNNYPKTTEEKILFLADKMVKYKIITVDKRFELWFQESLPSDVVAMLKSAYGKVKALEKEIMDLLGIQPIEVAKLVQKDIL